MSISGKKVVVLGGSGFVGNYLAARLMRAGANVFVLSRRGPRHNHPENKDINWLIGDIANLNPKLRQEIASADYYVHAIGTLFDSTIFGGSRPGDHGSYEQANRDTLLNLLAVADKQPGKRIVYISADGHPPFIHRYHTTKVEAQEALLASPGVDGYALRPGLVVSWSHRKWSVPLSWMISLWNRIYPFIMSFAHPNSHFSKFMSEFRQGQPTSLEAMGDSTIKLLQQGNTKHIFQTQDMHKISEAFRQSRNNPNTP